MVAWGTISYTINTMIGVCPESQCQEPYVMNLCVIPSRDAGRSSHAARVYGDGW